MAAIVLSGLFLAMLALAVHDQRLALFTGLFFASWTGLEVEIGLRILVYQLIMAPLVIVMLFRLAFPGPATRQIAVGGAFIVFILYAAANAAFQIPFLPQVTIDNSVLRGPQVRAVIQLLLFIFALSPVILVPILLRNADDVARLLKVWLLSVVVLAVFGWLQIIIWYGTGTNPIPIGWLNSLLGISNDRLRDGRFAFEGLNIFRMNSFTNEPRNLGGILAVAMVSLQAIALTVRNINGLKLFGLWLFFFVTAIFTYSTTFVGVWLIGSAVLLPSVFVTRVALERSSLSIAAVFAAVLVAIALALALAASAGIPVIELITERTIERLEDSGGIEDFDLAISAWLAADTDRLWFGGGLGNAHLFSTPFLDPEFARYAEGQVFVAKTMALRMTSELGLIGLALFIAFCLSRIAAARGPVHHAAPMPTAPVLALAMLAMLAATSQIFNEVSFMLGGLVFLAGLNGVPRPGRDMQGARAHEG